MSEIASEIRSLRRPRDTRLLGGLCAAISERFGVDVLIVRVLAVLLAAFNGMAFLIYLLGMMFVSSGAEVLNSQGTFVRQRRRRRQVLAYVFLFAVADAVMDNSLPTGKAFAVSLIVGGLLLMHLRNRTLNSRLDGTASGSDSNGASAAGGWTATPPSLPPRWGLAGEVANPQLWNPQAAIPNQNQSQAKTKTSLWQTQFGNLALVTLVGVLAIGLWSNTSELSPVRQAAIEEQFQDGPVVIEDNDDLTELDGVKLGDGSFTIDGRELELDDDQTVQLEMGNGKLEVILPSNINVSGSVTANQKAGGVVAMNAFGEPLPSGEFASIDSATTRLEDVPKTLKLKIKASNGFVCIRRTGQASKCVNDANIATPKPPAAPPSSPGLPNTVPAIPAVPAVPTPSTESPRS
jgi:phage shock protein PspC (stress-responsive transcriptional regulator)